MNGTPLDNSGEKHTKPTAEKREAFEVTPVAKIASGVGLVAAATLVSRLFGFGRWWGQASWVGADEVGNAYASVNQIPNVIFEVVAGGALASITVPLLAGALAKGMREEVNRTASALLTWTVTLLVPLALALFFLARPLAQSLPVSLGSDVAAQNQLATLFLQIFAVQVPLYGVAVVLGGVLQSAQKFAWPAIMPALSSAVTIAAYALYGWLSRGGELQNQAAILALGWGTTAGVVALALPLFWPVARTGIQLRPTWRMPRAQVAQTLRLGGFGIGTLLAAQGYMLVTLFLTRWGGQVGTINIFQYSQAIYLLPYALFTFPVATVVFPVLSRLFAGSRRRETAATDSSSTKVQEQSDKNLVAAWRLVASSTGVIVALAVLGIAGLVTVAPGFTAIFAWNRPLPGLEEAIVAVAPALLGYALLYHLSRVLIAAGQAQHSFWAALLGWGIASLAGWLLILYLAPDRGDSVATLIALGSGNAIGMTAAGVYLLIVSSWRHREVLVASLRGIGLLLPGCLVGTVGGRLSYGALLTWAPPGAVLWGTLLAGIVLVVVNLPALYVVVWPLWKQSRGMA